LLTASFRFGLATDTLAVQLALPLAGCALDFNQPVSTPCRAHKQKIPANQWACRDLRKTNLEPLQTEEPWRGFKRAHGFEGAI
jgi:hypothetical protein